MVKLRHLLFIKYFQCDKIMDDQMGATYGTIEGNKKCIHNFDHEMSKNEVAWETWAHVEGISTFIPDKWDAK